MDPALNRILTSQFHAALLMLRECIEKCPDEHWDSLIARYTFWQVAYHTLCMIDCRLDLSDDAGNPIPSSTPPAAPTSKMSTPAAASPSPSPDGAKALYQSSGATPEATVPPASQRLRSG